jgi:hypothetical protein
MKRIRPTDEPSYGRRLSSEMDADFRAFLNSSTWDEPERRRMLDPWHFSAWEPTLACQGDYQGAVAPLRFGRGLTQAETEQAALPLVFLSVAVLVAINLIREFSSSRHPRSANRASQAVGSPFRYARSKVPRGPSRVAHCVARCVGGARLDPRHCGRRRQERQQHQERDPKSGDHQFGWQAHDQILNGKTGEATLESKKARDCSRAVATFRGAEIRSCRRPGGHRRPKSKDGRPFWQCAMGDST